MSQATSNSPDNAQTAQCPQCQSRFRLTAQHLEAAKGWVQCGVCGHVFFSGLIPPAKAVPPVSTAAPTPPPITPPPPEPAAAPIATTIKSESAKALSASPASPILSGLANRMADDEPTTMTFGPKLESIILLDPNASHEDHDPGPMPIIAPRPEPVRMAVQMPPSATASTRQAHATDNWIPRQLPPDLKRTVKKTRVPAWLWWVLSILLILALTAQLAWFMRDTLAARYPDLRPALAQMCETLSCTLSLPHDAKQVVILGSDLQTEDDGRLILTINLANKAKTSMAWPVLELTLTDVEDQPLARRMFAPSEYLSSPKLETEGIAQLSEVPIALTLQSKDVKAAGYRLRIFY